MHQGIFIIRKLAIEVRQGFCDSECVSHYTQFTLSFTTPWESKPYMCGNQGDWSISDLDLDLLVTITFASSLLRF